MTQLYWFLVSTGVILICAEVFVPGGVLGALGALSVAAALVVGFYAFPGNGILSALLIVLGSGAALVLWLKVFPKSPIAKRMMLGGSAPEPGPTPADDLSGLVGREGESQSELRPWGTVRIDGRRCDAVSEGDWIARGERLRVVRVEGTKVVVRKVEKN